MVGTGLCVTLQNNATACPSLTVTAVLLTSPNPWKTKGERKRGRKNRI